MDFRLSCDGGTLNLICQPFFPCLSSAPCLYSVSRTDHIHPPPLNTRQAEAMRQSSRWPCWGQEWLKVKPHHCPVSVSHFELYFTAGHSKFAVKLHMFHSFNGYPFVHRCLRSGIYGEVLELTVQNIPNFAVKFKIILARSQTQGHYFI
jgi:hypothetical protein